MSSNDSDAVSYSIQELMQETSGLRKLLGEASSYHSYIMLLQICFEYHYFVTDTISLLAARKLKCKSYSEVAGRVVFCGFVINKRRPTRLYNIDGRICCSACNLAKLIHEHT